MRQITITKTLYSYSELSDEAKEKAIEHFRELNSQDDYWLSEMVSSLKALIKATNYSLRDWSLGKYNSWIKISSENTDELTGKRAFAWLENQLLSQFRIPFKGKKRFELAKYGAYYRPGMVKPCPFTGICYDDDFIDSLKQSFKAGMNVYDAICALADTLQEIYNRELDYQNSEAAIKESIEANEYEFDENGNLQ